MSIDEHGRPEPPLAGDEVATLPGFLDYQRATLAWKCEGLDADALATSVASSLMSLGGILKHMAWVEDYWCSYRLWGRMRVEPWASVDWDADRDWEWHSAADDDPAALRALWSRACDASRRHVADAIRDGGLDRMASLGWSDGGEIPSLRWILVHLIEEYARHNGHADLIRESIDGATGE